LPSNGYTCHNTNNVSILVVRILAEIWTWRYLNQLDQQGRKCEYVGICI
jgi:hypothetical protein